MFYHELKSRTWIQRENKPYFILNIHELEFISCNMDYSSNLMSITLLQMISQQILNLLYYQNSM